MRSGLDWPDLFFMGLTFVPLTYNSSSAPAECQELKRSLNPSRPQNLQFWHLLSIPEAVSNHLALHFEGEKVRSRACVRLNIPRLYPMFRVHSSKPAPPPEGVRKIGCRGGGVPLKVLDTEQWRQPYLGSSGRPYLKLACRVLIFLVCQRRMPGVRFLLFGLYLSRRYARAVGSPSFSHAQ